MKRKPHWAVYVCLYAGVVLALAWWLFQRPSNSGTHSTHTATVISEPGRTAPAHPTKPSPEEVRKKVRVYCGSCHPTPDPLVLDKQTWVTAIAEMADLLKPVGVELQPHEFNELVRYYVSNAPEHLPVLPNIPHPSPLQFQSQTLGRPVVEAPLICNVNIVDLDQNGQNDVVVCDAQLNSVSWLRRAGEGWKETNLVRVNAPAHSEVFDFDHDGDLDIVVAALGILHPSEKLVGSIELLINDGRQQFQQRTLLKGVARAADARPGDFDNDGDIDFVVALFGWRKTGEIGWLEQKPGGSFEYSLIAEQNGTIHVPPIDLNRDGRLDFIALTAQEHEVINLYLNLGDGIFEAHPLYEARNPNFGSSGIQLVDLDQDGDQDILYSNGDAFDTLDKGFKPYHGVQWLENKGDMKFQYHDIIRFYGVYRAVAADLDRDGDLDVAAVSMFNNWRQTQRQSIFWLENDGTQHFLPHAISNRPSHLVTADCGDLTGNGFPDIVAGGLHVYGPFDRLGRVTLWKNLGPRKTKLKE